MCSVDIDIHACGCRCQGFDYLTKYVWDIMNHFCLKFPSHNDWMSSALCE